MTAITIKAFKGMVPRASERLLAPNQATTAVNCQLTSGRIDPIWGLLAVTTVNDLIKTLVKYRVYRDAAVQEAWLTWPTVVDVVMSPLANDQEGRFYFVGDDIEPRMSHYTLAVAGASYPNAWYALGLPLPTQAPGVAVVGGSGLTEERAYVCTHVTALGEESGPSLPSAVVTGFIDGSWNLTGLQTAPPNSGTVSAATHALGRVTVTLDTVFGLAQHDTVTFSGVTGMTDLNGSHRLMSVNAATNKVEVMLSTAQSYVSGGAWARNAPYNTAGMKKRIYRTAGSDGLFFFVAEIAAATTTYADTVTTLGESLPTLESLPPPKNMASLVALPNGCLVGLADNELCFSEPYLPYSWPLANRYSFSGKGVALAVSGSSILVLTDGHPILYSGSDPGAMSPSTVEAYTPCASKLGVVSVGGGVLFPSFDGLWEIAPGRVGNVARPLYRGQEWSALNPETFRAIFYDGQYMASHTTDGSRALWVIDAGELNGAVRVLMDTDAMHVSDGKLYVAQGQGVFQWGGRADMPLPGEWLSAVLPLPRSTSFGVARVAAEFDSFVPQNDEQLAANEAAVSADTTGGAVNDEELLAYSVSDSAIVPVENAPSNAVQLTLYYDGLPVFSKNVFSERAIRLPALRAEHTLHIGLSSAARVHSVSVAGSMTELRAQA